MAKQKIYIILLTLLNDFSKNTKFLEGRPWPRWGRATSCGHWQCRYERQRDRPSRRSKRAEQLDTISVSNPHCFQCGPDPAFCLNADPDPDPNQCGSGSESCSDFAVTKSWIDMKIYLVSKTLVPT
jgi:hypothetical protein